MQLHPVSRLSFHVAKPIDKGKKCAESCNASGSDIEDLSVLFPDTGPDGPSPSKKSHQIVEGDVEMAPTA